MTDWRTVPGYEGYYEVSSLGQVRSLARVVPSTAHGGRRTIHPRTLKQRLDRDGYPTVTLTMARRAKFFPVHRLVALAFHGAGKNALHRQVSHLDGTKTNSSAENLKWVSPAENAYHKRLHGTHQAGEMNPRAKLKAEQVQEIRSATCGLRTLASAYGVSARTIEDIRYGRRWKCLPPLEPKD